MICADKFVYDSYIATLDEISAHGDDDFATRQGGFSLLDMVDMPIVQGVIFGDDSHDWSGIFSGIVFKNIHIQLKDRFLLIGNIVVAIDRNF